MPKHAAPRSRSPWRPLVVAAVAGCLLVGTGAGVFATLMAVATGTQSADTGTLRLTLGANGTFGTAITAAAPGDSFRRYVQLTNGGSLAAEGLTLAVSAAAPNELTGTAPTALLLTVTACSQAWAPANGTCGGTTTTVLTETAVGNVATARALVTGTVAAGASHHLQLQLKVPDLNEVSTNGTPPPTTVQGRSAAFTFTFAESQRPSQSSST